MRKKIEFYKLQASGNDFILLRAAGRILKGTGRPQSASLDYKKFAKKYCQRKFGAGADGVLVIEPSKKTLFKMRIFNSDGSEAEMCGNGARCSAFWASFNFRLPGSTLKKFSFETKAGIIYAKVSNRENWGKVKVKMVNPSGLKMGFPVKIFRKNVKVNKINTGVPHAVVFVKDVDKIDVEKIGREIRFHNAFKPDGTNVDFVEIVNNDFIKVRTYERGVEAETLACGTGVSASAVVAGYKTAGLQSRKCKFDVLTKSGEILRVYFTRDNGKITDVWLEGKAFLVYKGWINTGL